MEITQPRAEFAAARGGAAPSHGDQYIYAHGDRKREEPWTLAPAALLEAALDPATPVARAIVDAACALYETDFACFANANAHARSPGCAALVRARLAAVRR